MVNTDKQNVIILHDLAVGDEVLDDLTKEVVKVIGISYNDGNCGDNAMHHECWGVWVDHKYMGGGRYPWEISPVITVSYASKVEKSYTKKACLPEIGRCDECLFGVFSGDPRSTHAVDIMGYCRKKCPPHPPIIRQDWCGDFLPKKGVSE